MTSQWKLWQRSLASAGESHRAALTPGVWTPMAVSPDISNEVFFFPWGRWGGDGGGKHCFYPTLNEAKFFVVSLFFFFPCKYENAQLNSCIFCAFFKYGAKVTWAQDPKWTSIFRATVSHEFELHSQFHSCSDWHGNHIVIQFHIPFQNYDSIVCKLQKSNHILYKASSQILKFMEIPSFSLNIAFALWFFFGLFQSELYL